MKAVFGRILAPIAFLCSLMLAGPSQAQSNAYFYIAHGIPGRNISPTTNPEYPVDISANGTCIVRSETFGEILGPFTLPAAGTKIVVSLANTMSPCSNSPIYSVVATVGASSTYFGVLSLNASNAVTAELFGPNYSGIVPGRARVMIANVTGQNLTATLKSNASLSLDIPANSAVVQNLDSGQYAGTVSLEGTSMMEAGPASANLMSRDFYFWVLAGSATNNSVQIIGPTVIRDIF